jgi:N-acylneuraminate cytidylyltransferase
MNKSIAIITARGGSKRIPRKNIRLFCEKPIICFSIEAAISSGIFDKVMVSTDDTEIAKIALNAGAEVPFFRSANTSNDFATTAEVLEEVLLQYHLDNQEFRYGCCIYPTAPFVTADKLKAAFELLKNKNADSIIPINKFSFPIWRSFKMDEGRLSFNWPENELKRSQDLPSSYHDAGQFYFFNVQKFFETKKLVSANTFGLEVPESEVQDIDNEEDWQIAEIKYSFLRQRDQK